MNEITLTIKTDNSDVLRKTADYLNSLAGDTSEPSKLVTAAREVVAPPTGDAPELPLELDPATSPQPAPASDSPSSHDGVDLDGFPWNPKVHSTAAVAKGKDGRWKKRRGVPVNVYDEEIAIMHGQLATQVPPTTEQATPPPPPAPPAPAAALPLIGELILDSLPGAVTFPDIVNAIQSGKVTQQAVDDECVKLGLTNYAFLAAKPELVPAIAQGIGLS